MKPIRFFQLFLGTVVIALAALNILTGLWQYKCISNFPEIEAKHIINGGAIDAQRILLMEKMGGKTKEEILAYIKHLSKQHEGVVVSETGFGGSVSYGSVHFEFTDNKLVNIY